MNKNIVVIVVLGVGVAICHPPSEAYAGQVVPAQAVAQVQPSPDDPAWEAWRTDFETTLEADQKYTSANDAAESYVGDDADEYSRLEAARDARYRELARIVYTEYFGEWRGTDDAFDKLIDGIMMDNTAACAKAAVETCGEGKVCWFIAGEKSCTVVCQDAKAGCPAAPVP